MAKSYKKFDLIESAADGYRLSWTHRHALLSLALLPFAVKLLSYLVIMFLGLQDNYLRQGLLVTPSNFFEGWFVAYALRLVFLGESWPALLTGDVYKDQVSMARRRQALKASVIIYVLIKLVSALVLGLAFDNDFLAVDSAQDSSSGSPLVLIGAIIAVAASIWSFRYMWLYIPPALDYGCRAFLKKIHGFAASFELMGVWFVCFTPVVLVLIFITNILSALFPSATLDSGHMFYVLVWGVVQTALELVIVLVTSVALASGFYEVMEGKRR